MKTVHFVLAFCALLGGALLAAALLFPVMPALGMQALEKPPLVFADSGSASQVAASQGAEITVYQPAQGNAPVWFNGNVFDYGTGFALIKEKQSFALQSGVNDLRVGGLPKHVNPASVFFRDVTDPAARLVEQNYLFDVVSRARLLQKYVGETVKVDFNNETVSGTLLSSDDGLLIETRGGVQAINDYSRITFPSSGASLLVTPTLQWLVRTDKAGNHDVEYAFLASGLSWNADYVALVNEDDSKASLQGWASVRNSAGKTFENAALTLVAGDVNVEAQRNYAVPYPAYAEGAVAKDASMSISAGGAVTEQKFFEYRSYSVPGTVTLRDNEEKQIALLNSLEFGIKKVLAFQPSRSDKVQVTLEFQNAKSGGLGMPLPKGTVRVYKRDAAGAIRLIGEDSISHTAENEDVKLAIGNAFDVTAQKTETSQQQLTKCSYQRDFEVALRNAGSTAVVVKVVHDDYGDWEIVKESAAHSKKTAQSAEWLVSVPAKSGDASGTATLTFSIRNYWC